MKSLLSATSLTLLFLLFLQFSRISELNKDLTFWHLRAEDQEHKAGVIDSKLNQCEETNSDLIQRLEIERTDNEWRMKRSKEIADRFEQTTDILESVTRCSYYKITPNHCVGDLDLKKFNEDNRVFNF